MSEQNKENVERKSNASAPDGLVRCTLCNNEYEYNNETICNSCIDDIVMEEYQREERYVTKDMAIDAGEPGMEGMRI